MSVSVAAPPARLRLPATGSWRAEIGVAVGLVVLVALFATTAPNFLSVANLATLLRQVSVVAVIAVGMTLVIVSGEIDLSVGATVGLTGTLFAILVARWGWSIPAALPAIFAVPVLVGCFVGWLRVTWAIPTFITTLGLLSVLRGTAFHVSDGLTISPMPRALETLWYGAVAGIPVPVLITLAVIAGGWTILSHTRFGRHIYAVGGNPVTAARYGISVARVRIAVMVIVQCLAALGGLLLVARLNAGSPTVGEAVELDVIAAVIVGGTSLSGGRGRLVGTVLGVLFVAVLRNGMVLSGIDPVVFQIAQGLVIILAVWWSMLRRHRSSSDL